MPLYAYRAAKHTGRVSRGEMAAADENELAHFLTQSGMELIEARTKTASAHALGWKRKSNPRALAIFCTQMYDLLQSGVLFPEALRETTSMTTIPAMADALTQISHAIDNGCGIAESFAQHPQIFPAVFTATIGTGEKSGGMTEVFGFLARYTSGAAQTHDHIRKALRYPIFLFTVAGGAVAFMTTMVIPQIIQFLNGINENLPLATRILVRFSAVISRSFTSLLLAIALSVILAFILRRKSSAFVLVTDKMILKLPVVGGIVAKTSLARFSHSFAILFRSGCDIPQALRQSAQTISNRALQALLETATNKVVAGAALSQALDGIIPSFAIGVLRKGERSGDLGKSLDDLTEAYDREARNSVDAFIGLLEPCLTLSIGALLAWTVIAVLGPLYGSLSALGGRM